MDEPDMLFPDMVLELPAGVLCAKAGAAKATASRAAAAAFEIVFMVFPLAG